MTDTSENGCLLYLVTPPAFDPVPFSATKRRPIEMQFAITKLAPENGIADDG